MDTPGARQVCPFPRRTGECRASDCRELRAARKTGSHGTLQEVDCDDGSAVISQYIYIASAAHNCHQDHVTPQLDPLTLDHPNGVSPYFFDRRGLMY